MAKLVLRTAEWAAERDIDDVAPLGEADAPVLREIREVLRRHGALDRFGMHLLHRHFEIGDDERLVESADPDTRTLTIRPAPAAAALAHVVTAWRFDATDYAATPTLACPRHCVWKDGSSEHSGRMRHVSEG